MAPTLATGMLLLLLCAAASTVVSSPVPKTPFDCCEQGDEYRDPWHNCRHGNSFKDDGKNLNWLNMGYSAEGAFVRHVTCCQSHYATPSANREFPFQCAVPPTTVPLGGFGCDAEHPCSSNNAVCHNFSLHESPETRPRCVCASLDDPLGPTGACVWPSGQVPSPKRVFRWMELDIYHTGVACKSGKARDTAEFLVAECQPHKCHCASIDDPNFVLETDEPCTCWKSGEVPNGYRVQDETFWGLTWSNDKCKSTVGIPDSRGAHDRCSCPSPDDPGLNTSSCAWITEVPYGKRVWPILLDIKSSDGAQLCRTGAGVVSADANWFGTCTCASPDDPMDNPDRNVTCRWTERRSVPNGKRVRASMSDFCHSMVTYPTDSDEYVLCSCPSREDEAMVAGSETECVWKAGMVPPKYHTMHRDYCFFKSDNVAAGPNGTIVCPGPHYSADGPEAIMAQIRGIKSSWDSGVWAFKTPAQRDCYVAVSKKLTQEQEEDIRSRYGHDGIQSGIASSWKASLSSDYFRKNVRGRAPNCDAVCFDFVFGVLEEEFGTLSVVSQLYAITKVSLDVYDRTLQSNVDVAKELVKMEEHIKVKPQSGFANFMIRLIANVMKAAAKTFFKTNLAAKFGLTVAAGLVLELQSTEKPENYDPNASLEVAAAGLKSELNMRYLKLLQAYSELFTKLVDSPLKMRMAATISQQFNATTEADIADQVMQQAPDIRGGLVRILFPAKWMICYSQTAKFSTSECCSFYNHPCQGSPNNPNFNARIPGDRLFGLTDIVIPDERYGSQTFGWVCPNGRWASGTLAKTETYIAAGAAPDAVHQFESDLVRSVAADNQQWLADNGWSTFSKQGPCPSDD